MKKPKLPPSHKLVKAFHRLERLASGANLTTRSVKDKKRYTRKNKHRKDSI